MKNKLKILDHIFILLFFILLSSSAFDEWLPKSNILLLTYFYFIIRIFNHVIIKKEKFTVSVSSLLVVLTCFLSSLWSYDRTSTFIQSLYLCIQTFIVIYIANVYNLKKVLKLLFTSGAIIAICSFIVVILFPELGIDQRTQHNGGSWEGVFTHKNNLANVLVIYIIINIYLTTIVKKPKYQLFINIITTLEIILCILSKSTTGLVLLAITIILSIVLFVFKNIKNFYLKVAVGMNFLALALLLLTIFLLNIVAIINYLGKDLTLTGRDVIWRLGIDLILDSWFLGYGFKATSEFYEQMSYKLGFTFSSMHNGYLEIIANIGVFGSLFVLASFLLYIIRALIASKSISKVNYLPLSYLIYLIVVNLTESGFLTGGNSLTWCVYVYLQMYLINFINNFNDTTFDEKNRNDNEE